jgi:hypothetical protein
MPDCGLRRCCDPLVIAFRFAREGAVAISYAGSKRSSDRIEKRTGLKQRQQAANDRNHHFVVVYRRAKRDPGRGPSFWFGHVTYLAVDRMGLETVQRRIAFRSLDELPAIIRECIGSCALDLSGEAVRDPGKRER